MDTLTANTEQNARYNDLPKRVNSVDLDALDIPIGASLVIYDAATRKALFFRKEKNGYHHTLTRNKRAKPISVRDNDYILTLGFDRKLHPGDKNQVFQRNAAVSHNAAS